MSDTVPAYGLSAYADRFAIEAVRRIAAVLPARVAADYRGVFVTYGSLKSTIDAYRLVVDVDGLDDNAVLCAALMHRLPTLSGIADPAELAAQINSFFDGMICDTAA